MAVEYPGDDKVATEVIRVDPNTGLLVLLIEGDQDEPVPLQECPLEERCLLMRSLKAELTKRLLNK